MGIEMPMSGGLMPTYSVNDGNNNGMGGEGSWIWIILLLFIFGKDGGGMFGGNGAGAVTSTLNSDFITRDLFGIDQNVLAQGCQTREAVMNGTFQTQLGFQNLGSQMASCCCETNRNIDAVRFENSKNTCDITTAIHAEGEATRALINANMVQELRDQLQAAQLTLSNANQTNNIISALQPVARPAYLTCSPYFAQNGCGCGNI